jgi:thioredoxin-dependent peroxiredoxin
MSKIAVGKKVPDFTLPATGGKQVKLSSLKGQDVVLYFYPKDDTPGCTLEGKDFRDMNADFRRKGAVVLGVSRDSLKSHAKFCEKYSFNFDLLSDVDEKLCKLFDVIKMKNMYGKKVRGIERSTFLIGKDGVLRREWRKLSVDGHAAEVLKALDGPDPEPAAKPKAAKKKARPKKKAASRKRPGRKAPKKKVRRT